VPLALKAIGATVVLALVFIVAAILGGGPGGGAPTLRTPAPVVGAAHTPAGTPAARPPAELGYPAFATSNTTRVGGPDPASNAAGVALATYPSTDASQRPAAVALVDAADWQGGIAASVLMAAPLGPPNGVPESAVRGAPTGAPLLISESGNVPAPTSQALAALDPQGNGKTGGVQVFAIGEAAVPGGFKTKRIATTEVAAGAAAIAALRDRLFGSAPRHLVVTSADEPGFAMPAAAWAARSGDPVLFTGPNTLAAPTAAVLRRHPDTPVYVLGPSSAIPTSVVRQIAAVDKRVRRVSGEDPVSNAIALARYRDGDFGWNVNDPGHGFVVARSDSPLDAAAAAPLSASGSWGPLLLTDSADTLPAALRGYLLDVKPGYTTDPTRAFYNHVWVIGDEEAVDVKQQAEIDALAELAKIEGAP
jgi:ell wall binding domain 2 (CWB2)